MPRKRRNEKPRHAELSDIARRYFLCRSTSEDEGTWEHFLLKHNYRNYKTGFTREELLGLHGKDLLIAWRELHPKRRPPWSNEFALIKMFHDD